MQTENKITFVLTRALTVPVGGYKMVYEYAKRLNMDGYNVSIIYSYESALKRNKYLPLVIKKCIYALRFYRAKKWLSLDKRINQRIAWKINESSIPDGDYIIATAFETAVPVYELGKNKGSKLYFIQGYETWDASEDELINSYNLGMKNIAVSKWIQEIVRNSSKQQCFLVKNGIDLSKFYVSNNSALRFKQHIISFMWSRNPKKGSKIGLEAIFRLKEKYTDLEVLMFGIEHIDEELEKIPWIHYTESASESDLHGIFNNASIYICSSIEEGFGLTGLESMACGSALVSTKTKGVMEYAIDGYNAVLCEIENSDSIYCAVDLLFNDEETIRKISENGVKTSRDSFSIEDAYANFRNCLFLEPIHKC